LTTPIFNSRTFTSSPEVNALTARHCISRLASPVIWPEASAAMSAKLSARWRQKRPVDMPIRVSRLLLNGLSLPVLHRIFSSSHMNAGFAQNTAKQRTVFLGAFLKDRRTLPNTVCEAPREIRTESRFRHQLRRLFDLDARTCRKYKPSAPVLTPNRNTKAVLIQWADYLRTFIPPTQCSWCADSYDRCGIGREAAQTHA